METLWLSRSCSDVPWGFRLQGGSDFAIPLSVQRVTSGSIAASRLNAGDVILKIGTTNAANLSHSESQDLIRSRGNNLQLTIKKGGVEVFSPVYSPPAYDQNQDYQVYNNAAPHIQQTMSPSVKLQQQQSQPAYNNNINNQYQSPFDYSSGFRSISEPSGQPTSYGYISPVTPTPRQYYSESADSFHSPNVYSENQSHYFDTNHRPANSMNTDVRNEPYTVAPQNKQSPMSPSYAPNNDYTAYNSRSAEIKPNLSYQSSAFTPTSATQGTSYFTDGYTNVPKSPATSPVYNTRAYATTTSPTPYRDCSTDFDGSTSPNLQKPVLANQPRERAEENLYWAKPVNITTSAKTSGYGSSDSPNVYCDPNYPTSIDNRKYDASPEDKRGYISPTVIHCGELPAQVVRTNSYVEPSEADFYERQPKYVATVHEPKSPSPVSPVNLPQSPPPLAQVSPSAVPPPPPPPPPLPSMKAPNWRSVKKAPSPTQNSMNQFGNVNSDQESGEKVPGALLNTMMKNKDQKPFAYIPSGIDLKEIAEKRKQHYNQSARKGPKVDVEAAKREAAPQYAPTYTSPQPQYYTPPQQPHHQSYPSPYTSNSRPITPNYTYYPEPSETPTSPITPGAGSGTFVHGQYNSPLGLYSAEAATEELSSQSGGVITSVGGADNLKSSGGSKYDPCRLPDKPKINYRDSEVYKLINENESAKRAEEARRAEEAAEMKLSGSNPSKQSLSFKVLQWMTDTEKPVDEKETTPTDPNIPYYDEDCHIAADPYGRQVSRKKLKNPLLRHNSEDDEMRFSGLHSKREIPSKSFKMLQNLTVSDNQDEVSSQDTQDEDGVGNYCEASIRYKGKHIPSPSFRVLQNWAETDSDPTPVRKTRSKPKRPPIEEDEDKSDGPIEVRYSGGNIPSRVFKVLQMSVGSEPVEATSSENPSEDEDRYTKSLPRQSRSMRVIQKAKLPETTGCTDF